MTPEYLQFVVDAILAVGVIAYAVAQWRNGSSKISSQTVQAYKDQLDIMERRAVEQQKSLTEMSGTIGELKGLIAGKDTQIADYRKILENRNPNLEKTLSEILLFMQGVDKRLTDIAAHQKLPFKLETHATATKQQ